MEAKEFGAFIRKLRKDRGMNIEDLGRKLEVSQPFISNLENGKKGIPKPDTLRKFSVALDVPFVVLMTEAGYVNDGGSVPLSSFEDLFPPSHHEKEKKGYISAGDNSGNVEFQPAVGAGGGIDYNNIGNLDIYDVLKKSKNVKYKSRLLEKDDIDFLITLLDRTFTEKGD